MKIKLSFLCSVLMVTLLAACSAQPTAAPDVQEPANADSATTAPESVTVDDFDSLLEALRSAGASVEAGDEVEQPFFTTAGQIVKVNGADVQVFVYDTAQAMEAEAAQVAADGGSVGTSMLSWMAPPHFYKFGRMIVLYVGEDPVITGLLESILGTQFAGR
jgi:hypothetical protein